MCWILKLSKTVQSDFFFHIKWFMESNEKCNNKVSFWKAKWSQRKQKEVLNMDGIKRYFVIHSKDANQKLMLWLFEISMFISTFAFNTKWKEIKIKKKTIILRWNHREMLKRKRERDREKKHRLDKTNSP